MCPDLRIKAVPEYAFAQLLGSFLGCQCRPTMPTRPRPVRPADLPGTAPPVLRRTCLPVSVPNGAEGPTENCELVLPFATARSAHPTAPPLHYHADEHASPGGRGVAQQGASVPSALAGVEPACSPPTGKASLVHHRQEATYARSAAALDFASNCTGSVRRCSGPNRTRSSTNTNKLTPSC